jgi:membrane protein YdbS with pleckstrin-like domain
MSIGRTAEARRTAGFIGVSGLLLAVAAGALTYFAFHNSRIVAAATFAIAVFVAVWGLFLALAMVASLFSDASEE